MEPETLPQPPPDVPAPPPGEAAQRSRRWADRIIWLGIISIIGVVWSVSRPVVLRSAKKAEQTQATSNARQIGMALFEFESDYGEFPNASTAKIVREKTSSKWVLGDGSSNELFRQLLASGVVKSEDMFYASAAGTRKPDGKMTAEKDAIATGECGFAYFQTKDTSGNPSRPLLICPVLPGTHQFDPKPFHGRAIVLRLDNSVQTYQIAPDGHVIGPGGWDVLDPDNPVWGGTMPPIKWPELLPPQSEIHPTPWIWAGVIALVLIILVLVLLGKRRAKPPTDGELAETV